MKILIIGASGFIGSNLSSFLSSLKYEVYCFVRKTSNLKKLNDAQKYYDQKNIPKIIFGDIKKNEELTSQFLKYKFDIVINSAAYGVHFSHQDEQEAKYINTNFCEQLINICNRNSVKHLIHLGTGHEYGFHNEIINEKTSLNPVTLYGKTKAIGGKKILNLAKNMDMKFTYLRPFAIYGQFQDEHMFMPLILRSMQNNSLLQLSPGNQKRDYLHIDDFVASIHKVIESEYLSRISLINIAYGESFSLKEIAKLAVSVLDISDKSLQWGRLNYRGEENMNILVSNNKAKIELGWVPKIKIESGIIKTYKMLNND